MTTTMEQLDIRDARTEALLKDAAALYRRNRAFEHEFDRRLLPAFKGVRRTCLLVGLQWLGKLGRHRAIPWDGDELIDELLRRKR